jgi:hypothetical protein
MTLNYISRHKLGNNCDTSAIHFSFTIAYPGGNLIPMFIFILVHSYALWPKKEAVTKQNYI